MDFVYCPTLQMETLRYEWIKETCPKCASQVVLVIKNPSANAGDVRDANSISRKIPWRRAWQPTPVFLPGESHGQRSLEGYSPLVCKVSDMTE